jgi:hypothetical protein
MTRMGRVLLRVDHTPPIAFLHLVTSSGDARIDWI